MKKKSIISTILFLIIITAVNGFSQDFYDINTINTIELTFTQSNWDYELDRLVSEGNEERMLATAVVNGIIFDSVGVRYKGNSSYNANQKKNPFNIKLDYVIDDQEYGNYGTLKLANVYNDPTFVRETLGYEIARNYMSASLANYAKVYVNGTYIGLYTNVQDVDKYFLRSNFSSDDNTFFKGELTSGGAPTVVKIWGYFGDTWSDYTKYYEIESDEGWADLINFLDVLNNDTESVEDVLNVDCHLWMLAYDNLFVNLDSPINFAHNYYLYQDDAGQFNPIIWDLNENFGVFSRLLSGGDLSTSGLQKLSPYLNANDSDYPIISKVLSDPTYKKMYVAHMKTILNEYISNGYYKERALEIQSIIDSEVNDDPNKFYTYSNFTSNIDAAVSSGGGRPGENRTVIGLTQLMDTRADYLISLDDFQAECPVISDVENSENPSQNSNVWITATVSNATSVKMAYRSSSNNAFEKMEMLDDGNNNDGSASDDIYGVSVPTGTNGFQYYIYAENDDAAAFSPQRAAYEFYTLTVSGNLVINEFMASNETNVSDQDGEFDDWIELFNNTDEAIPLAGYFLSDDSDDLASWTFPDTSIAANSFLIVWADKDEEQTGLHANFKLSASGETIFLCNQDTITLDEVSFGGQTDDISTGRIPNGIGAFVQMSPTFSAVNSETATGIDDDEFTVESFSLSQNYPNPFNPTTTIQFSIPSQVKVELNIYDLMGKKVKTLVNSNYSAGNYDAVWNGTNENGLMVSSGIYFYQIKAGNQIAVKKMSFMK